MKAIILFVISVMNYNIQKNKPEQFNTLHAHFGKAPAFGAGIRRFETYRASQKIAKKFRECGLDTHRTHSERKKWQLYEEERTVKSGKRLFVRKKSSL